MIEKLEREWSCYGDRNNGKEGHVEHRNMGNKCAYPNCGLPRPENLDPGDMFLEEKLENSKSITVHKTAISKITDKSDKDKVLFAALSILNLVSGYTTIVGAVQIFPGIAGYVSGGIIQIVLFLLLSGSTARHAPIRKWLTVGIFSFISVYTSFFAYYNQVTAKDLSEKGRQRALVSRQKVRSEVVAPLEDKVRQLQGTISQSKTLLQREIDGQRGVEAGDGQRAGELRTQIEQKELELAKLKPSVENFQKKFSSSTSQDSPEAIFQNTIQALEFIPNEYRPSEYKGDLNKLSSVFFDEDTGIPLLAPYRKVVKGEDAAIAAMLLALGVDGLIIILGTAIEKRKHEIYLPLKGKASDFLQTLHDYIEPATGLIRYGALITHPEKESFRILLDAMRKNNLRWVEVRFVEDDQKWYISEKARDQFNHWYQEERQYQSALEAKNPSNASHSVTFVLPSRK